MIGYPTNRLVAVVDDPERARAAVADLVRAGVRPADVRLLVGPDAIVELRNLGAAPGPLARLVRVFQFMSMDQMPDFVSYEAALRSGRALVAVTVKNRQGMLAARDTLAKHGAHFANWFGRFMTEEVSPWRGPEPDVPDYLRR